MKYFQSILYSFIFLLLLQETTAQNINRKAIVQRHTVHSTQSVSHSPAQVGNGKFAFGMDITGLQTFILFNTLSNFFGG